MPENIDALYLGGGYPEVFAKELMKNTTMRHSIQAQAQAGLPIYAECGGLMYLMDSLENREGEVFNMVSVFEGQAKMTDRLQHFGHVEATLRLPIEGEISALNYRGHEFHHSIVTVQEIIFSMDVKKKDRAWQCGYHKYNVLGTYVHNHFYSNLAFLKWFIQFLSQNK